MGHKQAPWQRPSGLHRQFPHHVFVIQAMKAVTPVAPPMIGARQWQARVKIVAARMEGRIETGDMRHIGHQLSQHRKRSKPIRKVQGCQFAQGFEIVLNALVNANRRRIARAAMHDAVANTAAASQCNALAFDFRQCCLQSLLPIARHLSGQQLDKPAIENRKLERGGTGVECDDGFHRAGSLNIRPNPFAGACRPC